MSLGMSRYLLGCFKNLAPNSTHAHTLPLIIAGITTLLTTCTIALTGREGIPKVSYSTALDIFLLMCFSFVFAALVEYAGVFYFTKSAVVSLVDKSDEEEEVGDLSSSTDTLKTCD